MISLFLVFAMLIAIACHAPVWAADLILVAMAIHVGFEWGRWRRRDGVWIKGFSDRAWGQGLAKRSADEIRDAYRKAGHRTPIILNVPLDVTIERNPHR